MIPLILIAYWRRTLPETQRFHAVEHAHEPVMKNIGDLFSNVPRRTIGLFGVVFGVALAGSTGGFFAPKYLQDVHSWEPSSIAMLNLAGGALAIVGNPLAGWLSDRFGRNPLPFCSPVCSRSQRSLFMRSVEYSCHYCG